MIRRVFLLSAFSTIALRFRAPDKGGAEGGEASTTTETAPEANPEDAEAAPEPDGKTIEQRLTSAKTHLATFFNRAKTLAASLKHALADKTKVESQFSVLEKTANDLKAENTRLTSELGAMTSKHGNEEKRANGLAENCTRLEKLCGLNGVDHTEAVAQPGNNPGSSAAKPAVVQEYEKLVKDEADGKAKNGTAFKFYQKNQKELDAYMAAKS